MDLKRILMAPSAWNIQGTGKTHFLVENIENIIITNALITRSQMRKILCVTYTNAAVDEIKRRLDKFTEHVEVHTIHSFIIEHIIQPFQQALRNIMESDFGIGVGSKGKISSQVEGLGILHGIDKNEIYEHLIPEIQASIKTTTAYEFIQ